MKNRNHVIIHHLKKKSFFKTLTFDFQMICVLGKISRSNSENNQYFKLTLKPHQLPIFPLFQYFFFKIIYFDKTNEFIITIIIIIFKKNFDMWQLPYHMIFLFSFSLMYNIIIFFLHFF